MIEREKSIPELYLAHTKYNSKKLSFNYEDNLIKKCISPVILKNDTNKEFFLLFQKMLVYNIELILELRNSFNHTVNKFYGDHTN